ncbi:MAG: hypothetical protein AABX96_01575 [Nanoarchaeota archaeon]
MNDYKLIQSNWNALEVKLCEGIGYLKAGLRSDVAGIDKTLRIAEIARQGYVNWVNANFEKLGFTKEQRDNAIQKANVGQEGYGVFKGNLVFAKREISATQSAREQYEKYGV